MFLTPWIRTVKNRLSWAPWLRRHRRYQKLSTSAERRMDKQAELLEQRTLLTGPQFVSVSPNVGTFLQDGDVRTDAPQELLFQLSPGENLDATTLGAITITAAGGDSEFTPASAITDFGTGGLVLVEFGTQRLGEAENGTLLTIDSAASGLGPTITGSTFANEVQEITLDSSVSGGTFTLEFGGVPTSPLLFNASAADVQTALEGLPVINPGDVVVTGGPLVGAPIAVEFTGAFFEQDVPALIIDSTGLQNNEFQSFAVSGNPTGGVFQVAFDDPVLMITGTSQDIGFNATAAEVEAAIVGGIPALGGLISVTGGDLSGSPVSIEFIGVAADTNVTAFTLSASSLTGGTSPAVDMATLNDGNLNATLATLSTGTTGFVRLTLDSTAPFTVQQLLDFVATDPVAQQLLRADLLDGDASQSTTPLILTLGGAGAASVISDFDTGTDLRVQFRANTAGLSGNDISIQLTRLDLGDVDSTPQINVVGNRIEVVVNENTAAPTTAQDLVDAIGLDAAANALVTGSVVIGTATTDIATAVTDGTLLRLSGGDQLLTPGYRDVAASTNEVIYRFGEPLANDVYQIQMSGTGHTRLKNTEGEAFESFADRFQTFGVNLGGQVNAVVPQPVLREQALTITDVAGLTGLADGDTITIDAGVASFAAASTGFNSPAIGGVTVAFEAVQQGAAQNGISVTVNTGALGGADPTVSVQGRTVTITLDTDGGGSTAQELADAVSANVDARNLIDVVLTGDDVDFAVGGTADATTTLTLVNAVDLFTFEIDDSSGGVRAGNTPINVTLSSDSPSDIAMAIANAINGETLSDPGVTATATGDTVSIVGGAFDVRVDTTLADPTAVTQRAGNIVQRQDIVVVYLVDDLLDSGAVSDPQFYQLYDTNSTFDQSDDLVRVPDRVLYDRANHRAVLEFAGDLGDATYRLETGVSNESNNTRSTAIRVGSIFDTTGFADTGFIGDDAGVNDVDLYEVQLTTGASLVVSSQPDATLDSVLRLFDSTGVELIAGDGVMSANNPAGNVDLLTWTVSGDDTYYIGVSSTGNEAYDTDGDDNTGGGTSGSYRILITTNAAISADDSNSSFATATDVGVVGTAEQRFSSQIEPQSIALPQSPGGTDEPGHRSIPHENHGPGPGTTYTNPNAIGVVQYNFASVYGADSQGNPLINQINEDQKDRTREIYEMYASLYGFEVRETASNGTQVVTGDIRATAPTFPPGAIGGIAGGGRVIMNSLNLAAGPASDVLGGGWFQIALHEIGHSIGLGHSYDIRSVQGNGTVGEDNYPGNNDIVHAQRLHRVDATDIDVYKFTVTQTGVFSAETIAERLSDEGIAPTDTTSLLNSALRLYEEGSGGVQTLIAQNDDYFSNDSYIEVALEPGTYYISVSSTGNVDYDPTIIDSGSGGLTDGDYDLALNFTPESTSTLEDRTGLAFDGDNDGTAGGTHEFHFTSTDNTGVAQTTTLNGAIAIADTTITVIDASAFTATTPFSPFFVFIGNERLEVTNVDTMLNQLTVTRGVNGTVAVGHSDGDDVRISPTKRRSRISLLRFLPVRSRSLLMMSVSSRPVRLPSIFGSRTKN
jgi:hypothetical protein